jgi:pimeloyl-ACP methyl ester carboxylesterase
MDSPECSGDIARFAIIIARAPWGEHAVVEHAGHFTPLEEPDEVGAFLREWIRAPLKAVAG